MESATLYEQWMNFKDFEPDHTHKHFLRDCRHSIDSPNCWIQSVVKYACTKYAIYWQMIQFGSKTVIEMY